MRKISLLILAGAAAMSFATVASAASGINTINNTGQTISVGCTFKTTHTISNGAHDSGVTWGALDLGIALKKQVICNFRLPNQSTAFATATISKPESTGYKIVPTNTSSYTITLKTPEGNQVITNKPITLTPKSTDQDSIEIK